MEGIAKIKEKIMEEARAEKQKLIEDTQAKARDIKAKYERQAEEMRQDILERAKKTADEKKRRILSMAQLENRKAVLQVKQQIIDEVFIKAKENLKKLPDEDYQKLFGEMLVKSVISGNEELIISEQDKNRISPDFLNKVNEYLKSQGMQGNLKISETCGQMIGGFILKSEDLEVNNTFDSLINMEREELETEIAKILFEE
ncbi:MAG: V-type ATP synthase subunit E family protein [Tepidanaerobacteraceae bacterium]|nr:V-type ATP synthase subunit E family protein [Tepidanaerobacteraceae bacterium]